MTATVAGVDGCRGGWICVLRQVNAPFRERAFLAKTISEVLTHSDAPAVIAIDIPIGFPERITGAGRECDLAARAVLGKRAPAVFAAPARSALAETDYRAACAAALAASDPPRQISKQMFHLFPKIREVDLAITPSLQDRVYECHPEASFWAMNSRQPLHQPKKLHNRPNIAGLDIRRALLMAGGFSQSFLFETKFRGAAARPDDFLDACACAWTACRIHDGGAIRFPPQPPLDANGLRMEIWA
jgi:predicted RNase H-like nuclease